MLFPVSAARYKFISTVKGAKFWMRIITNFSYKQRLQRFVAFEYGLHFFKIFHLMENFTSASFRDQMCLLSSVEFLYLSCRNEVLWFAYLVLNFPSVNPT